MTRVHLNKAKSKQCAQRQAPVSQPERARVLSTNTVARRHWQPQTRGAQKPAKSSGGSPSSMSPTSEGETLELMEGRDICRRCKGRNRDCWRLGSARRGRGRPAKHPVVIGAIAYGRCVACREAKVPCTTVAMTRDAPSGATGTPTQAMQHQDRLNKSNCSAASTSAAPRSATTIAPPITPPDLAQPSRRLLENVANTLNCVTDIVDDSIYNLRESVQELRKVLVPRVKLNPSPPSSSATNKYYAYIRHYASPAIQEAINASNASIDRLEEAVKCLLAVPHGLPGAPDSDSEDSDVSSD